MISIAGFGVEELRPRIAVIGVGGGGGNAVDNMIRGGVAGVDFIAANTDAQALNHSLADRTLQLGRYATLGLGAGSRAEVGRAAAEESLPRIMEALEGVQMCFIAAGMGGGTGTGAAPVIARAARESGILTVGVVTKPFAFEGSRRARAAEVGIDELAREADTLIVLPNQNLFRIADAQTTFKQAFELADSVLHQGVRSITSLILTPGLINLDFADVRTVMMGMGRAMMGTGEASGDRRALEAAERAIANPLLDDSIAGARGLIISIAGGEDLGLMEVDEAAAYIKERVDPEADIIWGSAFDPELEGRMRVSIVATGLEPVSDAREAVAEASAPVASIAPVPEPVPAVPASQALGLFAWTAAPPEPQPEGAASEGELLLCVEEMAAPEESEVPAEPDRPRGPSLFERMASAARGAVKADLPVDAEPPFYERRIARG